MNAERYAVCTMLDTKSNSIRSQRTLIPTMQLLSPAKSPRSRSLTRKPVLPLYHGLSSEEKARMSLASAFAENSQFHSRYAIHNIVGFGSNGVVLAAQDLSKPEFKAVAIKVIYKPHSGNLNQISGEVQALKAFADVASTSSILQYVDDWQDANHFYLVTELFGSDWMSYAAVGERPKDTQFRPIIVNGRSFQVHSGSSDLWAWSYVHRLHLFKTEGHTLLAFQPIQSIIKQAAVALSVIHSRSFYHGDVKIENIIIQAATDTGDAASDTASIRLADFGHSKYIYHGIKSYGTKAVSPPELLHDAPFNRKELDGRSADVYALGMCLYTLLNKDCRLPAGAQSLGYFELLAQSNGYFPFEGIPDLCEEGWNLLHGMCRIDPAQRMSMAQVLAHPWLSAA